MRLITLVILMNAFTPGVLQADSAADGNPTIEAQDSRHDASAGLEVLTKPSEFPGIEPFPAEFPPPFFADESLQMPIVNNIDASIAEQLRYAVEQSARLRSIGDSHNAYLDRGNDGTDYKLQQQIQKLSDYVARPKPAVEKPTALPPADFDQGTIKD